MFKKILALLMSLVMIFTALPLFAFAKNNVQKVAAENPQPETQEDISINTAEDTLAYDENWEDDYPNGTFAFASMSGTITEGTNYSESALRIPVYRLGGVDGVATAIIRYVPMVSVLDDQSTSYAFAISSKNDITLKHEDASPISEYQRIAYPDMAPAPDGVYLDMNKYTPAEDEEISEDAYPVSFTLTFPDINPECLEYIWQYKNIGEDDRSWRSVDESNSAEFLVDFTEILDEDNIPLFDYRVIYKTEDGYFCSPTLFTEEAYNPEACAGTEAPSDIELNAENTFTKYKPEDEYAGYEFTLTFADGEFVKYIDVSAINDSEFEVDKFANFAICGCIGGKLSTISNTFSLALKDDDASDMRESTIGFSADEVTASKDEDSIKIEFKREGDLRYIASVHYETVDNSAKAGVNYAQTEGDIMFYPGSELGYCEIPLITAEKSKNIDFKVVLSDIKGGEGKCTLGTSELTVIIPSDLKTIQSQTNGVADSGNNLSSILTMSDSTDATANMQTAEESLLHSTTEDEIEIVEAVENEDLIAEIRLQDYESGENTYDYDSIKFRRSEKYNDEFDYWKDKESPYYNNQNDDGFRNSDIVNYSLSEPEIKSDAKTKSSFDRKTNGIGGFEANYHSTTPSTIEIPHAGLLFNRIYYEVNIDKVATCRRFLIWMWNYTMPWMKADFGDIHSKESNFGARNQKSDPLGERTQSADIQNVPLKDQSFKLSLYTRLNNADKYLKDCDEEFTYIPKDTTSIKLKKLEMWRRVMPNTDQIALRIYTSNDADTGNFVVNQNVYKSIQPKVSMVKKASGVNKDGQLYVGSKLCVELQNSSCFAPYSGSSPDKTVFVTDLKGNSIPAKIEKDASNSSVYYITFMWDNMTEADINQKFRINVVYERRQVINLDLTPSLIRDESGNAKTDAESIMKSWNHALASSPKATVTYSVYNPDLIKNGGCGYETKTVTKPITELFGTGASIVRSMQPNTDGIVNIQKINFGLSENDKIVFNGYEYQGDETIELKADEVTAHKLNFLLYNEDYLKFESRMNITLSTTDLYFDGNGNGKIDGYYDESAGLFILDETSGDIYCGTVKDQLPEGLIEPKLSADGKVLQYFFKVYYNITPRALLSKKDTAQILPSFIPQDTDEESLEKLTDEQKACRMVTTSGSSVLPYNKKTGKTGEKYDLPDTAEGHLMYGAAATKRSAIDFPLGGDMRAYKGGKVNGKELKFDFEDYCGNLRFEYKDTKNILTTGTSGKAEQISDVNGYVGSFLNRTTFVCGVQPTRELKSNNDFMPETLSNSGVYAVPANNVSNSLQGNSPSSSFNNMGGQDLDQKKIGDFNGKMQLPHASFSALGANVKLFDGNKIMITFGIPFNLVNKPLFNSSEKTKKNADGSSVKSKQKNGEDGKKINEEQEYDKDGNPGNSKKELDESTIIKGGDGSESRTESKILSEKDVDKGTKKNSIDIKEKDENGEVKNEFEKDWEIPDSEDDSSLDNKLNNETSTKSFFRKVTNDMIHYDDVRDFFKKKKAGQLKDDFRKIMETRNKLDKKGTFTFDVVISAYCVLEYNALNGGWAVSSAAASVGGSFAFSFKFRIAPFPLIYIFANVSLSISGEFNWSFKRTYTVVGDIDLPAQRTISGQQTIEFPLDMTDKVGGLRVKFKGKMLLTVYNSKDKTQKPALEGRLCSGGAGTTDVNIKHYSDTPYVVLQATEGEVTIDSLQTLGTKIESQYDGFTIYNEFGFQFGVGVGVDAVGFEVFGNVGAKATIQAASAKNNNLSYVKDFNLRAALSIRVSLILFNISADLVGITYKGERSGPNEKMKTTTLFTKPFKTKPIKEEEEEDDDTGPVEIIQPQSTADQQQIFNGISDPEATDNAFRPTDDSVKFELSGYGMSGDAFKLADNLDAGYKSKAFVMNGETYLLYMISDPDSKDNGINASRLALSKIVINAKSKNRGLANPISEDEKIPYIFVDNEEDTAKRTGNLSFSYSVDGTKLKVVYTGYDKHFTESEVAIEDVNKHIVVKSTSIDIAKEGVKGFDKSEIISENTGMYHFAPTATKNNKYYAETISNNGETARLENMRAYLKAVYGINEEDYIAKDPEASKIQNIYRYKTYKSNSALNGDGSHLVALNSNGERIVAPVGENSGEIITELTVQNIDGDDVLIYLTNQEAYFDLNGKTLTKEEFTSDTDYAVINRMYARSFDGNKWSEPLLLSQTVDFEKCSEQNIETYPLTDGLYTKGSLEQAFSNPSISNVNFLLANLGGKGAVQEEGVRPILVVEVNGNTLLLDNDALCNLIEGKNYEAKPIFNSDLGTSVQITTDAEGNLLLGYIKVMEGTENNAVYCAWWDKETKSWGDGKILAMNHMSVYEAIYKYSLTAEQTQKAYHGELTGNEAYDKAVAAKETETGAYDRFQFTEIQLLPTKTQVQYIKDEKTQEKYTETLDGLMLLSKGNYCTLEKIIDKPEEGGEELEIMVPAKNYGTGFYAVAFGQGDAAIGNESIEFSKDDFSCGSILTGKLIFTNTGTTAIRGSKDQPIKLQLIAENKAEGFKQIVGDYRINNMIASGEQISYDFNGKPLQCDLPENTEFRILVSEDEEYVRKAGGVAFNRLSDSVFTVKYASDVRIEQMSYEVIATDADSVYIATDFVIANRGSMRAENLFMQYSVAQSANSEVSTPVDITGTVLRVNNETKIIDKDTNDGDSDLAHGKIALKDDKGESHLSPGYMRSVSGVIKVSKTDFAKYEKEGMRMRTVVFSDSDSYTLQDGLYNKLGTEEYTSANAKTEIFILQTTEFYVPTNIRMNMNNTLRVPISYDSTSIENEIVVREISNGAEEWKPLFNDIHYDSNNVIVAVAKHTGQTVIQIENTKTNSLRNIIIDITNGGFGVNIFKDDDSFKFYNQDGTDAKSDIITSNWVFKSDATSWPGENKPPMANDYCYINKEGAWVTFNTVATTLTIYYSGKIMVTSDGFPDKEFVADNTGKKNEPLTVRFDNLDSKHHMVTITALSGGTSLDRYTATYAEDTGTMVKSDKSAPSFYWARSFPNTASLKTSNYIDIGCFVLDESGVKSISLNGEEIANYDYPDRVAYFEYCFTENGQYNFVATDIDGNKTTHSFAVYWFNDILNQDAIHTAPAFGNGFVDLIDGKGKVLEDERTEEIYIANSYNFENSNKDKLSVFTSINQDIDFNGNELTVYDYPSSERTYQKITEKLSRNGFYISRVISENGTWSLAVNDITQLITEPTKVTVHDNNSQPYFYIDVDASKSGLLARSIKVNGYELKFHMTDEVSRFRFDLRCRGDYSVEVFDGVDTFNPPTLTTSGFGLKFEPGVYTTTKLSDFITIISVDPTKVIGAYYDEEKSIPEQNIYYPDIEVSTSMGDRRADLSAKDIYWNKNLNPPVFSWGYYTLGIRSLKDHGGWRSGDHAGILLYVGEPPQLDGSLLIQGEPQNGETIYASYRSKSGYIGELSYQWFRKDKYGVETKIAGANLSSYTVTPDDYFCYLGCVVTSDFETGSITGISEKRAYAKPVAYNGDYDGKEHSVLSLETGRDDVIIVADIFDIDKGFDSYTDAGTYKLDYYMVYNNEAAPEAYQEQEYLGDYVSGTVELNIQPIDISNAEVELENYTYDSTTHHATPKYIMLDGIPVDDYNITGNADESGAGKYDVTIQGRGNYTGERKATWEIYKKDITDSDLKISFDKLIYNGKEQTCIPKVTLEGFDRVEYEVTGNKATEPGEYEMTLTGTGNFTGELNVKWSISAAGAKHEEKSNSENTKNNPKKEDKKEKKPEVIPNKNGTTEGGNTSTNVPSKDKPENCNNNRNVAASDVKTGDKPTNSTPGNGKPEATSPQTGDNTQFILWVVLLWSSLVVIAAVLRRKKYRSGN